MVTLLQFVSWRGALWHVAPRDAMLTYCGRGMAGKEIARAGSAPPSRVCRHCITGMLRHVWRVRLTERRRRKP
jgi:hypothetical protein